MIFLIRRRTQRFDSRTEEKTVVTWRRQLEVAVAEALRVC
ncbi:hypothetical protein V6Z11_A10G279700 [Gossypium hirsutum]